MALLAIVFAASVFAMPSVAHANVLTDAWNGFVSLFAADNGDDAQAAGDVSTVADASTLTDWQNHLTTDGKTTTQNVGRIWTDKTVSDKNIELTHTDGEAKKTIDKGTSDFLVGLSALSSTSNLSTTTNKPLDISLVLDVSGSMNQDLSSYTKVYGMKATGSENDYDTSYYTFDDSGELIHLQWKRKTRRGSTYGWRNSDADNYSSNPNDWYTPKSNAEDNNPKHAQFYEIHESGTRKLDALKAAAEAFIDEMAKQNEAISDAANKHQITVVKFADDSVPADWVGGPWSGHWEKKPDRVGNEFNEDGYNRTQIVKELSNDATELKNAVDNLEQGGATAADYGFDMAARSLNENHGGREGAQKVVIFFTDGEPNHQNGWSEEVANAAISKAKSLKDSGALVYSIGVFGNADPSVDPKGSEATNFDKYMHGVSSNYKKAESLTNLGDRTQKGGKDANYYFASTSPQGLNQVFKDIASDIQNSTVGVPTNTTEGAQDTSGYITFTDQLGDYMKVDDFKNIVYADTVYGNPQKTTNDNVDTYVFSHEVTGNVVYPATGNLGKIIITVTRAGDKNLKTGDKVEVKIPASLIPLRNFKVDKAADGSMKMDVADAYPIRVFYGVSLKEGVAEQVANGTFAGTDYINAHKSDDGSTVYFYSNAYTGKKSADKTVTIGDTMAVYEPASNNSFYYFTANTPVYKDEACTEPVKSGDSLDKDSTFYYKQTYFERQDDGSAQEKPVAVAFKGSSFEFDRGDWGYDSDGNLYIKADTPRLTRAYDFNSRKEGANANPTQTAETYVNTDWDSYTAPKNMQAFLGNNGRIGKALPGTLAVSKTVSVGEGLGDYSNKEFTFNIKVNGMTESKTLKAAIKTGNTLGEVFDLKFGANSTATQKLKGGQTLYVYGIPAGTEYTVTEESVGDGWSTTKIGDTGTISANKTSTAAFTNTYSVTPATLKGETYLKIQKNLQGRSWQKGETFKFVLSAKEGTPMPAGAKLNQDTNNLESYVDVSNETVTNFGDIEYAAPGVYTYTIFERTPVDADQVKGTSYSREAYTVTVTVENNGNGGLTVKPVMKLTIGADGNEVADQEPAADSVAKITNTFDEKTADGDILIQKILKNNSDSSHNLKANDFTFKLKAKTNGAPMPAGEQDDDGYITTKNIDDGSALFGIEFNSDDHDGKTYMYELREAIPDGANEENNYTLNGMKYDPTVYTVKISVGVDSGTGALHATVKYYDANGNLLKDKDGKAISRAPFNNVYTPSELVLSGDTAIKGSKKLTGRNAQEGEVFTFTLAAENGDSKEGLADNTIVFDDNVNKSRLTQVVENAKNGAVNDFSFGKVEFKRPGTYTFTVKEGDGDKTGLAYDKHAAIVTVKVEDKGSVLTPTVTYNNNTENAPEGVRGETNKAAFENAYKSSLNYSEVGGLQVTKKLTGRSMKNGEFKFTITGAQGTNVAADKANAKLAKDDKAFANGPKAANAVDVMDKLQNVTFTQDDDGKTYVYLVNEKLPVDKNGAEREDDNATLDGFQYQGVTYDQSEYRVEIAIADDVAGNLTATTTIKQVKDGSGQAIEEKTIGSYASKEGLVSIPFENSYAAGSSDPYDTASVGLIKVLSGRDWTDTDVFTFNVEKVSFNNENTADAKKSMPDPKSPVEVKSTNADKANGKSFGFGNLTFTQKGTYVYKVTENHPNDAIQGEDGSWSKDGLTYSKNVAIVTFVVEENSESGKFEVKSATVADSKNTFTNQYGSGVDFDTAVDFKLTKTLNGRDMEAGEFKFDVRANATNEGKDNAVTAEEAAKKIGLSEDKTTGAVEGAAGDAGEKVEMPADNALTPKLRFDHGDSGKTFSYTFTEQQPGDDEEGVTVVDGKKVKAGVTYDNTSYTMEVTPTDIGGGKMSVAVKVTKTVGDGEAQTVPLQNNQDGKTIVRIDFVNTYAANPGTMGEGGDATIKATKELIGRELKDKEFKFTAVNTKNSSEVINGSNDASGNIAFDTVTYTSSKLAEDYKNGYVERLGSVKDGYTYTYSFKVTEVTPDDSHVSLITPEPGEGGFYTILVKVQDDCKGGKLNITVDHGKNRDSLPFVNEYGSGADKTIAISGIKELAGTGSGKPLIKDIAGKYTFALTGKADDGTSAPMPEGNGNTAKNDENGNVTFGSIKFTMENVFGSSGSKAFTSDENVEADADADAGEQPTAPAQTKTFTYTVTEEGSVDNITNDFEPKTFTVTVTDNGDGTLSVTTDPASAPLFTFTNTYTGGGDPTDPPTPPTPETKPVTGNISATKVLTGRDLKAGEFTFEVLENGKVIGAATNAADGSIVFPDIKYTEAGTHTYEVREVKGDLPGVEYDGTVFTVIATVTKDSNGQLSVSYEVQGGGKLEFRNAYKAKPTSVGITATKVLMGRDLKDGEFTFELTYQTADGSTKTVTAKNDATGAIVFPDATFDKAGTYDATIREVKGSADGIAYDGTVYNATVTVTDDGKGNLVAEVTYKDGKAPVFTNTYTEPDKPAKPEPKPEEPKKPTLPSTGDTQLPAGVLAVIAAAGAVLVGTGVALQKRRR